MLAFLYGLHGLQVDACLVQSDEFGTRCGTRNQQLVAYVHFGSFYQELRHTDVGEVADALTHIDFTFRSGRAVVLGPFAQALSQVVAVPESTIKDGLQAFVPTGNLLIGECIVQIGTDGFFVTLHYRAHVLGSAGTSFYFENANTCIQHLVHEVDSF